MDEAQRAELLAGSRFPEEHLLALGRIVELTATIDLLLRIMLGHALGLLGGQERAHTRHEAVLISSRTTALVNMLTGLEALSETDHELPPWLPRAAAWARDAKKLADQRDALVHRPAWTTNDGGGPRQGLGRGRRDQGYELLQGQASHLVEKLVQHLQDGERIITLLASSRG